MPILYGTNESADIGLAKYATVVAEARKKREHLLVIDNGDLIQGTPLMTHYVKEHTDKVNPMIGIMNQIGTDVGVIGNHEFNFGAKVLNDAIEEANYPWLSANILDETTRKPKFGPPYVIKELSNGVKVAIVGVTTHYIPNWESPNHIQGIQFADAFQTLQKWVPHIRETEQPDILIAAYHGGFECDLETGEPTETLTGENQGYQMCQEIAGIDVLLTGHQHRKLTGMVNDILIIQPGNNGQMYGEIQIDMEHNNGKWSIEDKRAELHALENVASDPSVIHYMADLEASTQTWLDQPIGSIDGDMSITDPLQARIVKHPFIQFIQEVQMDASGADISVTSLLSNHTTGFSSTVTMREVVSNYMFPNTLVVLELTGAAIKAALEKSANYFILDDNGEIAVNPTYIAPKPQHYNYDMWEGIDYTINVANEQGSRVERVSYHGKPLETDGTYRVVLNNYRASGGGDFDMFREKPVIKDIQRDTVELIGAYFEEHPVVKIDLKENFVVKAK